MSERTLSTTARDAVHNFSHYAAMVDAGAEVIITRRGRASLKLVRAEPAQTGSDHALLIERAMAVRSSKPLKGKFARSQAYED